MRKSFTINFLQRKRDLKAFPPANVKLSLESFSRSVLGGPKLAIINATGPREDLYEFLNWLRYKVTITNQIGVNRWWGIVSKVEVYDGKVKAVADIDWMYNRVATAFTTVPLGEETIGLRGTTDWVEDETSINEMGIRELLDSRGGTNLELAENVRNRILDQTKYPTVFFEPNMSGDDEERAVITCRGWWYTLEWMYARIPTSLALGFDTIGTLEQNLGEVDVIALAQSLDTAAAINLQEISIYIKRTGLPSADLTVAIYENPDDETPGAQLASATIAAASVGTDYGWVTGILSAAYELSAATSFFLVVATSGTDESNYYTIILDQNQGYGAGVLRQKISSTWSAGPDGDMPFRLYANELIETTQQIKNLVTMFGQFFRQVRMEVESGLFTESYRNGDSDAQFEIEDLMETGTDNSLRIFSDVDLDRSVRFYEQPASSVRGLLMDRQGIFRYVNGQPVELDSCPVGVWVWPRDIVPSNVDMSLLLGIQGWMIEESEYIVETGELRYTAANTENPFDLGVRDG